MKTATRLETTIVCPPTFSQIAFTLGRAIFAGREEEPGGMG